MKHIAIFCDGTWQNFGQTNPTNVARLARATLQRTPDGRCQVIRYDDGVGVGNGTLDQLNGLIGGAFGRGLDYKLARAYEFLSLNYEVGDRIYLFGFSRGAYTVRSLAGLLRQFWVLKPENTGRVAEAVDIYRARPDAKAKKAKVDAWLAEVMHFHKLWSHPVSDAFVGDKAYDPADPDSLTPADPTRCAWLQYLGVWDTVGSLGIPSKLPFADLVDAQYEFHDLELSRFVRSSRHAVALDERRETFVPTLWENVPALNTNAHADTLPYQKRPYQQRWFPGVHGAVGGGGASPVSLAPLLWIAEGAARAGLALDPTQIEWLKSKTDPTADFDQEKMDLGSMAMRLVGAKWRDGPEDLDEISEAAKARMHGLATYDPHSLEDAVVEAVRKAALPNPLIWFDP
ncbi:MAG: Peptidoglycan binding domain protein [Caulobacteraceae bacterium]|nr:Peptidoglycan binding domain protein [Caulobacteraceae bacterium]